MAENVEGYTFIKDLYYWRHGHTWATAEDGKVRIGITSLGADMAGDIILVRFRPVGTSVEQGKPVCTIESAKWVGPVESPVSGEIVEVNLLTRKNPRVIRGEPYGEGWLTIVKPLKFDSDAGNLVTGSEALEWFRNEAKQWNSRKKG